MLPKCHPIPITPRLRPQCPAVCSGKSQVPGILPSSHPELLLVRRGGKREDSPRNLAGAWLLAGAQISLPRARGCTSHPLQPKAVVQELVPGRTGAGKVMGQRFATHAVPDQHGSLQWQGRKCLRCFCPPPLQCGSNPRITKVCVHPLTPTSNLTHSFVIVYPSSHNQPCNNKRTCISQSV